MLHFLAQSQYDLLLLAQIKANKTSDHMIMGPLGTVTSGVASGGLLRATPVILCNVGEVLF